MIKGIYHQQNILKYYTDLFSELGHNISLNDFLKNHSHEIIEMSNAFDIDFYVKKYPDVKELSLDPINHYLKFGYAENCSPNSSFNTQLYYNRYCSELNGLNPFVHYILYKHGDISGEINREISNNKIALKNYEKIMKVFDNGVTIIIPIFNAYEDTKSCIESVFNHTTVNFKLILIDDCSTDRRIRNLLNDYDKFPNVEVVFNKVNKGFTKNINMGIKMAKDNDVILLNSDTIVTPRWVQKIIFAAYSEDDIGTLTPISNASDISVPKMNQNNEIPHFLDVNSMAYLVEKSSFNGNLTAPTGNGFCLFIKRETINDIGLFDEEKFDKGYGEETDFTLRAKEHDWKNVRNDSIFIYHKRSASFSSNKANDLKEKHKSIILQRYPNVFVEWGEFLNSEELNKSIKSIQYNLNNFEENLIKQNILYITSIDGIFPKISNIDLLSEKFNIFLLTLEESKFKLWVINNNEFILICDIPFFSKFPDIKQLNCYYLSLFNALNIDSIFLHINNSYKFLKHSHVLTPITLASKMGIPIRTGSQSTELISPLINFKSNKDIFLDNIIEENAKIVIYTALFGDYEELLDPKFIDDRFDYVCFTDNPDLKSNVWEIRLIDNMNLDNVRKAREVKILPHKFLKDYDYSIWVDAGFQIVGDLYDFINRESTGKSMLAIIHSDRNCVYDEAEVCIKSQKDDINRIKNQVNNYKKNHFPEEFGLIESGFLFRKHNDPDLINVMEDWYFEVVNFSKRDQLSLPYVLWKNNLFIDKSRIFVWKNQYLEHFFHQKINKSTNVTLDDIHIIIIGKEDEQYLIDKSVSILDSISDDIRFSIIWGEDDCIKNINNLSLQLKEKLIIIINAGELLNKSLFMDLSKINLNNLDNVGVIVYDDESLSNMPNFKPNFSPDLFLEYDYIKNSVVINNDILLSLGGFDESMGNDFIKDFIFKVFELKHDILKRDILGFKLNNYLSDGSTYFFKNFIKRNNIALKNDSSIYPIYSAQNMKASIIIPFKDQSEITENCVRSILDKTEYQNYEIILVNNNSYEDKTLNFINSFSKHEKITFINYSREFNYSKINNYAVKQASGDVLVFLNNDTEIISDSWLELLIGDSIIEGVGAVGAKLYYPDMSIQHLGVVIGLNGLAGHLFAGESEDSIPDMYVNHRRNVSAVTGACMAIKRETFEKINGFDELFDITGSDVEICLRLLEKGYRNIVNPKIELIHYEKKTRSNIRVRDIDIKLSLEYYGPYLEKGDLFFNSNFSLNSNKPILKKNNEKPIFKEFLENYNINKFNHGKKLNNILKSRKRLDDGSFDAEVSVYDVTSDELLANKILMNNFFKNPHLELNTSMWFMPFFDHIYRGGIYTIFRIANHFSKSENTHNIFVLKGGARREISVLSEEIHNAFPNLDFELIDLVKFGDESQLPKSNAAFCTLWTTAYNLVKYNNCDAKFYLNQDYEAFFVPAGSVSGLIEETYRFNFIGVANTEGVKDKYEQYGNVVKCFTPAIDDNVYYPGNSSDSKKRVVFYGRPKNSRNGFVLGSEALKIVKEYFGDDVEIFSAGAEYDVNEYGLDGVLTNLGLLDSVDKVADLYRKCDVGLVFMFTPHPSYQPFEYMACGCATVTNINEGNMWLLKDKENSILSEPVISCVAENIINLLNDDHLRKNIINNGFKTINRIDWDDELNNIVKFVKNPLNSDY